MPKRTKRIQKSSHSVRRMSWLPIDSRLLPPIFSFGHVKGVARVFLSLELILSSLVVTGTVLLVIFGWLLK